MAVLGANGAGKSTLMGALCGLNRPVGGRVLLLGRRIEAFSTSRIVGEGLVLTSHALNVAPLVITFETGRL